MSDAKTIGTELVALCREGKNIEAMERLYADDVVSVEAAAGQNFDQTMAGKAAVIGKGTWWQDNHEVHGAAVKGPYPHGDDKFAVHFAFDVTNKPSGQRFDMDEVAVYNVADGKIVREEFFYTMG